MKTYLIWHISLNFFHKTYYSFSEGELISEDYVMHVGNSTKQIIITSAGSIVAIITLFSIVSDRTHEIILSNIYTLALDNLHLILPLIMLEFILIAIVEYGRINNYKFASLKHIVAGRLARLPEFSGLLKLPQRRLLIECLLVISRSQQSRITRALHEDAARRLIASAEDLKDRLAPYA